MNNIFTKPSFWGLPITGLMILFILIILFTNFNNLKNININQKLIILSLITIVIGIHSILHLGLEYVYGYNPIEHPLNINVKN